MSNLLFARVILLAIAISASVAPARGEEARWRQIPLIEDGKIADGWKHVGWGEMKIEGDALVTAPDERGLGLFTYTKEKFGDCQIRIVWRPENSRSNAGVYVRIDDGILDWVGKESVAVEREENGELSEEMLAKMEAASNREEGAWYAVHHGFEVQLCDAGDAMHATGSIYSLAPSKFQAAEASPDNWRTMTITLDGDLVKVEQDGKLLSQFNSAAKNIRPRTVWYEPKREPVRPRAGYIGLQTHDPGDTVYFREVSVRKLEK